MNKSFVRGIISLGMMALAGISFPAMAQDFPDDSEIFMYPYDFGKISTTFDNKCSFQVLSEPQDGKPGTVRLLGTHPYVDTIYYIYGILTPGSNITCDGKEYVIKEWNANYWDRGVLSIDIPETVTSVGSILSMSNMVALDYVSFPRGLRYFTGFYHISDPELYGWEAYMVSEAPRLRTLSMDPFFPPTVKISSGTYQLGYDCINNAPEQCRLIEFPNEYLTIYVPEGSEWFYQNHPSYRLTGKISASTVHGDTFTKDFSGLSLTFIDAGNQEVQIQSVAGTIPEEVTIPESVEFDGITYSVTSVGKKAFKGLSQIKRINFPETLSYICDEAFRACGFTELTIPPTLLYAAPRAFADLKDLKEIKISFDGDGVETPKAFYAPDAFSGHPEATELKYVKEATGFDIEALPWSEFRSSSVAELGDSARDLYRCGKGKVVFAEGVSAEIFNANGIKVTSVRSDGDREVSLAPGIYEAVFSNQVAKFQIR